ncbi:MAG: rRNA maturation RNase YbeY [Planctomycetes bacterium]|nr:rRNA maturation RNase YbeY [Planctomycetota bacterium]
MTQNADNKDEVQIQFAFEFDDVDLDLQKIEDLIQNINQRFNIKKATVEIAIVDDEEIIAVNKKFLGHNNTTDVISFDLTEPDMDNRKNFQLIINAQQAQRQAAKRNHSTQAEIALYITHGLLHQLGFDDLTDEEAKIMHSQEDKILQENNFGSVYNSQSRK